MQKLLTILSLPVLLSLTGCATTSIESKAFQSYQIKQIKSATIGNTFLVDQKGYIEKQKVWVGFFNSSDGWKIIEKYSEDYIRKELIYTGRTGSTIEISYREYRNNMAAQAFFQNLKYDLNDSKIIRFQNFKIEVLSANNQELSYMILSDR